MNNQPLLLCHLNDLTETGSQSIELPVENRTIDIMVVQENHEVYAYLNHCPHTGSPLEWREHHFLTEDKKHIICASHAALFRIKDGYCVSGPCKTKSLTPLSTKINNGSLYLLELPPEP